MSCTPRRFLGLFVLAVVAFGASSLLFGMSQFGKVQTTTQYDSTCGLMMSFSPSTQTATRGVSSTVTATFTSTCTTNTDTFSFSMTPPANFSCSYPTSVTLAAAQSSTNTVNCTPYSSASDGSYSIMLVSTSQQRQSAGLSATNSSTFTLTLAASTSGTTSCGTGYISCPSTSGTGTYCNYGTTCPTNTTCGAGYISCPSTASSTGGTYCYYGTTCPASSTDSTSTSPKSCPTGERCVSGSWCNSGQSCYYPNGDLTCVAWNANGTSASCPSGTSLCKSTDTYCMSEGQTAPYSSGKYCMGSQSCYSTDGTQMSCVTNGLDCPAGYSTCSPSSGSSCIPTGSYGSSSGWCSNGMSCYQTTKDTNANNDKYCVKWGYTPAGGSYATQDSPTCPSGYSACDPTSTNCKQNGDTWSPDNTSYWCTNGKKCPTATGGVCMPWSQSCPAVGPGTTTCPSGQTMCYPTSGSPYCANTCPIAGSCGLGQITCYDSTNKSYCYTGSSCPVTVPPTTCAAGEISCYSLTSGNYCYKGTTCPLDHPSACSTGQVQCYDSTNKAYCHTGTTCPPPAIPPPPPPPPLVCPAGEYYCSSKTGSSYCSKSPSCSSTDTGTTPKSCSSGEKCPKGSWCSYGQSCYYPDASLTCTDPNYYGVSTTCPAGTSACNPTDTYCVPNDGKAYPYSSGKYCTQGMSYYSTDGKSIMCFSWDQKPPAGYTNCRPDDTNCIPTGGYGSESGWCSQGMKCSQILVDSNSKNDVYCAEYSYTAMTPMATTPAPALSYSPKLPTDSVKCPAGYSLCSRNDTNCRQKGDTWKEKNVSIWCTDSQKCTLASGGGTCVGWNEQCPAGTQSCDENQKKYGCLEPNEETTITSTTSYPYCGGSSGGMVLYSPISATSYKAVCTSRPQSSYMDPTWVPQIPAGGPWQFCKPGDKYCIEPGKTGPKEGWCAWMAPMPEMSYMMPYYDDFKSSTRTCPALGEKLAPPKPPDPGTPPPKEPPVVCPQVVTPAKNLQTGECTFFPTPCDVPKGWVEGTCKPVDKPGKPDKPVDQKCIDNGFFADNLKFQIEDLDRNIPHVKEAGFSNEAQQLSQLRQQIVDLLNKLVIQLANSQCEQDDLVSQLEELSKKVGDIYEKMRSSHTDDYLEEELLRVEDMLSMLGEEIERRGEDSPELLEAYQQAKENFEKAQKLYEDGDPAASSLALESVYRVFERIGRLMSNFDDIFDEELFEERVNELVDKLFAEQLQPKIEELAKKFEIKATELVGLVEKKLDGLLEAIATMKDTVDAQLIQIVKNLQEVDATYQAAIAQAQESTVRYEKELSDLKAKLAEAEVKRDYISMVNQLEQMNDKILNRVLLPDTSKAIASCMQGVQKMVQDQQAISAIKKALGSCKDTMERLLASEDQRQYDVGLRRWKDTPVERWDYRSWEWAYEFGVFKGTQVVAADGKVADTGQVDAGRAANVAEAQATICRLFDISPPSQLPQSVRTDVPGLPQWNQNCNYALQADGVILASNLAQGEPVTRLQFAEMFLDAADGAGINIAHGSLESIEDIPDLASLSSVDQQEDAATMFEYGIMKGYGEGHPEEGNWGVNGPIDRAALCTILQRSVESFDLTPPSAN